MKYVKAYEDLLSVRRLGPEIGDYVICKNLTEEDDAIELDNFLSENIGQYISFNYECDSYCVRFKNVSHLSGYFNSKDFRYFGLNEIIHWSKNKEDLEIYIDVNKYNL